MCLRQKKRQNKKIRFKKKFLEKFKYRLRTWRIKQGWVSKFKEFLRTPNGGHLAVVLIRGDYTQRLQICGYIFFLNATP